jgi:hypothetical protein
MTHAAPPGAAVLRGVSGRVNGGYNCYLRGNSVVRVEFFLGSVALNSDPTMADGMQCMLDTTRFANGTHSLKATAYDSSGKVRSEIININMRN